MLYSRLIAVWMRNSTSVADLPTGAGPIDSSVSSGGALLYVETGGAGAVDTYPIGPHGSLIPGATVLVPGGR